MPLHDRRVVLEQRRSPTSAGSGSLSVVGTKRSKSCRAAAGSCVARSADQSASASMCRVIDVLERRARRGSARRARGARAAPPPARAIPPRRRVAARDQERAGEREERVPADDFQMWLCARCPSSCAITTSTSRVRERPLDERVPEQDAPARAEPGRLRVRHRRDVVHVLDDDGTCCTCSIRSRRARRARSCGLVEPLRRRAGTA